VADEVEAVIARLRAQGRRITAARRAVITQLVEHDGHMAAGELADRVREALPDVHESTVYRALEDLTRLGIVVHSHLAHGPAMYHLATERHAHLVCDECGASIEVPATVTAAFARALRKRFDFEADLVHFALSGRCSACRQTPPGVASRIRRGRR
jgi:Fur family ferric uptake transcriptional regulator